MRFSSKRIVRGHEQSKALPRSSMIRFWIEDSGAFRVSVSSQKYVTGELSLKSLLSTIAREFAEFLQSADHLKPGDNYFVEFPAAYRSLNARGAQFHVEAWMGDAHSSVSNCANTFASMDQREHVIRVLDGHRKAAKSSYRRIPTRIILFLTNTKEYFYNTIEAIQYSSPSDSDIRSRISDGRDLKAVEALTSGPLC
jgi:hypothetical protein